MVLAVSLGALWQASIGRVPPVETAVPQPTESAAPPTGTGSCFSHSSLAGAGPSHVPGPIPTWSPEFADRDWPGPLRVEPGGAPADVTPTLVLQRFSDTPKEAYLEGLGYIDIEAIHGARWIGLELAAEPLTIPDPNARWLAYGFVIDADLDGVPDYRVGMDNALGVDDHREWATDLVTGTTEAHGPPYGGPFSGAVWPDSWYAGDELPVSVGSPSILFAFGCPTGELRFYAWASVVEDGRIVTDFAPDSGWLRFAPGGVPYDDN
jgi:hypothetical protein